MSRRRIDPAAEVAPAKRPSRGRGGVTASDRKIFALCAFMTVAASILHTTTGNPVIPFVAAGAALATLASLVGRCVEALGDRLGPGSTGVLQSFLANLPEIFVILFALQAGLYEVVKATIVGSILANVLLIAGFGFLVGGIKHGRQKYSQESSRHLGSLLVLSVFALAIPTLSSLLHTPAAGHEREVSMIVSAILLTLFVISLPETIKRGTGSPLTGTAEATVARAEAARIGNWPMALAVTMLLLSSIAAAFVSKWFVDSLTPAMETMHISPTFAGLIIVAIAGNAVENFVGIQLAARNQSEYAIQVILQSPVQVAMIVTPLMVLCAPLVGASTFTLVLSPMLLAVLFMSIMATAIVVADGDSTWFEGAVLIGLYIAIACSFWWG